MKFILGIYLGLALIIGSMNYFGTDAERWAAENEQGINQLIKERTQ